MVGLVDGILSSLPVYAHKSHNFAINDQMLFFGFQIVCFVVAVTRRTWVHASCECVSTIWRLIHASKKLLMQSFDVCLFL